MGQGSQTEKWNKIYKVLQYQEEGKTFKDITDTESLELFGYSKLSVLKTALKREQFRYNKELGVFEPQTEQAKERMENRPINISELVREPMKEQEQSNTKGNTTSNTIDTDTVMNVIRANIDEIRELIGEPARQVQEIDKEQLITINTDDKVVLTSYRVFEGVKQEFKEYCKEHKQYKAQELISQALTEFMANHK